MDTLGNILYVNFLVYAHWFMPIKISQLNDHYITVNQDRYATSIVTKYLDTATIKENSNFHKTTFPHDMIFSKEDAYTSD